MARKVRPSNRGKWFASLIPIILSVSFFIPCALPISSGLSNPQESNAEGQLSKARDQITVQVSAVSLFATVRNRDNQVLSNLTVDDFRVYEDGREQKVALFASKVSAPITVGLLIDTSRSERHMLSETGGRAIEIRNQQSLDKALGQISEELRSQYVIGYYPTNTKHDGTFRKIRIQVTKQYAKVLTRRGYYAPKG